MELTATEQKFILHWGTMGTQWGINRTVAQVHALLFISPNALTADEIVETLRVARSNVSTSLKELQNWGIVRPIAKAGDRRDYFETVADVWELFRLVLEERKRREFDPTIALLRECLAESEGTKDDEFTRARLGQMLEFFELIGGWFDQVRKLPNSALIQLVRLGGRFFETLERRL
jgi:DNA-binding transcriptional regulator GbsR (MarR family)